MNDSYRQLDVLLEALRVARKEVYYVASGFSHAAWKTSQAQESLIVVDSAISMAEWAQDSLKTENSDHIDSIETSESNDKLIFAVPELMSALKRIAAYPETSHQELGIEAIKAIARVAIERVEGDDK